MFRTLQYPAPPRRLRVLGSVALAVVLALTLAIPAFAGPGDLDPTWGNSGIVVTNVGVSQDTARSLAVQPADGKVVAAGFSATDDMYSSINITLVRYNTDGTLDTTFGNNGIVSMPIPGANMTYQIAYGVKIDGSGRIVIAGMAGNANMSDVRAFVGRFQSNGSPDTTFGTGGFTLTSYPGGQGGAMSLDIDASGNIVVAGWAGMLPDMSTLDYWVLRYLSNGHLDTTFGSPNGWVTTDFNGAWDNARSVKASGGKIYVGGGSDQAQQCQIDQCNRDWSIARYNSNGTLDTSFSGDGKWTWDYNGGREFIYGDGLLVQPNGYIVAAGPIETAPNTTSYNMALIRLQPNGTWDTGFGTNGVATLDLYSYAESFTVPMLQPDGKIVVSGLVGTWTDQRGVQEPNIIPLSCGDIWPSPPWWGWRWKFDYVVARYTQSGQLDSGYGTGGYTQVDASRQGMSDMSWGGAAMQSDGKVLIGGESAINVNPPETFDYAISVIRVLGDQPTAVKLSEFSTATPDRTPMALFVGLALLGLAVMATTWKLRSARSG